MNISDKTMARLWDEYVLRRQSDLLVPMKRGEFELCVRSSKKLTNKYGTNK